MTKLNLDVERQYLIRRTNHTMWDKISHFFMDEWHDWEVIQEEFETYKITKEVANIVETESGDTPNKLRI